MAKKYDCVYVDIADERELMDIDTLSDVYKRQVFCKGGGCTAKLGPDLLSHVLAKLPRGEKDSNLLIGYDSLSLIHI